MEGAHDVIVSVDVELLFVGQQHLGAAVFWKKDSVANFDGNGAKGSVIELFAWTNCDHCSLVQLHEVSDGAGSSLTSSVRTPDSSSPSESASSSVLSFRPAECGGLPPPGRLVRSWFRRFGVLS